MKKLLLLVCALTLSLGAEAQAPIRGQISAGSYGIYKTDADGYMYVVPTTSPAPVGVTSTNQTLTVTNASQALVAANTSRKFFFIQNNDAAGIIYVTFGATSTTTLGVKLSPGQSWQITSNAPIGSVNLIGSIASNANVVYVDGQ